MSLDVTPSFPSVTADAVLNALPHPVIMVSADGKIADAVDIRERAIATQSADLGPIRIHGVNGACIAVILQGGDGLAAASREIRRRADDRDAARIEKPLQDGAVHRCRAR